MRTTALAQSARARAPRIALADRLSRVSVWTGLVAAAVAAGLLLRVWVLASELGVLEADEAIVGLMARRALDGDFAVLYWLSLYGGTQEAYLTAVVFAVTGSSVLVLKLVPLALFCVVGVLLWRLGVRTVGEPAARLGAALYWIWPAYLVWWTTKARAYYATGLLCEVVVLLLVLRLRERASPRDVALLGFTLGFAVWATLQSMLLSLPALAWLVWRRPGVLRLVWIAVPGFVLGAFPWLAWNAVNDWKAVVPDAVAGEDTTYAERFTDLFTTVLPTWLGLRVPYSLDWLLGPAVGAALTTLAIAAFLILLTRRRDPRLELLLFVGAAFPFVYAASTFTYFTSEPRYLVYLTPVTALLGGKLLARGRWVAAVGLAAAFVVTTAGLVTMERQREHVIHLPGATMPEDIGPLIATLEREGEDRVLANYWIAYRLSFETGERILATSTGFVRDQEADRIVRASPHPARVFIAGAADERRERPQLEADGFRRLRAGGWIVYVRD
jgi:hypothetical protein